MKNLLCIALFVVASLLLAQKSTAQTPTLEFTWVLPSTYDNGAPLTTSDLASVQLYDVTGVAARVATWPVGQAGTFQIPGGGERKYAISVVGKNGLESDRSNVVTINMSRPSKASALQVRVLFTAAQP